MKATGRRALALPSVALLAACLAACASSSPPATLLALPTSAAAVGTMASPSAPTRVLVLRRVAVPEYLSARRVRYRADPSTLAEWPNTLWAERVEIGMTRELAADLRAALPDWTVCETSCGEAAQTAELRVDFAVLDYTRASRRLQAQAHLLVVLGGAADAQTRQVLDPAFDIATTADTPQAQAQAMAEALKAIAQAAAPLLNARP